MHEDKNTGQIWDQLHYVYAVVFLTPIDPRVSEVIQKRLETGHLSESISIVKPTSMAGGTLLLFDTQEALKVWEDAVGSILGFNRIQYIQARLVDPVFGVCSQEEDQKLTSLGLHTYCDKNN